MTGLYNASDVPKVSIGIVSAVDVVSRKEGVAEDAECTQKQSKEREPKTAMRAIVVCLPDY